MLDVKKLDIPENCNNFFDFIYTRLSESSYWASDQIEFLDYIINTLTKKRDILQKDRDKILESIDKQEELNEEV